MTVTKTVRTPLQILGNFLQENKETWRAYRESLPAPHPRCSRMTEPHSPRSERRFSGFSLLTHSRSPGLTPDRISLRSPSPKPPDPGEKPPHPCVVVLFDCLPLPIPPCRSRRSTGPTALLSPLPPTSAITLRKYSLSDFWTRGEH